MRKNCGCTMNVSTTCREQIQNRKKQKRIVLGLGPTLASANIAHQLRVGGWDVATVANGEEARRAAVRNCTHLVVMPYVQNDALATAKVINAMPRKTKVILVIAASDPQVEQFAEMMGVPVVVESGAGIAILTAVDEMLKRFAAK